MPPIEHVWVFAYGSLVNCSTWSFDCYYSPATVSGWRRQWGKAIPTSSGMICALSAVPDPDGQALGLIIKADEEALRLIGQRERGYTTQLIHPSQVAWDAEDIRGEGVRIYTAPDGYSPPADAFIPLSYLDTVVEGFYTEFGEKGVRHFFETTAGWMFRIMDDRASPLYPRAKEVSNAIHAMADRGIDMAMRRELYYK